MGMELEFIDISKDEENEIPRASNDSSAGRMSARAPRRRSRAGAPVMIDMEGRRSVRTDRRTAEGRMGTGKRESGAIRSRGPEELQPEMPVRRRPGSGETAPKRRPGPGAVESMPPGEAPRRRPRPGTVEPMLPEETPRRRSRPGTVTPMLPEEPSQRRPRPKQYAPQRGNTGRRPQPPDPEAERKKAARRRRRRRKRAAAQMGTMLFLVTLIAGTFFLLFRLLTHTAKEKEPQPVINATGIREEEVIEADDRLKPLITEDFLTINEYSRPGEPLEQVNNIFVHYTANPGTSAAQNRSYFENLGITGETSASAHFVIGYDGEIVQCIPLNEIAYAVMKRNYDSVSIECCYLTDDGKFTDATYQSLIRLSAWLLNEYNLAPEDMRRHYDEGGKKCPLYYVENEEAWEQFLRDLEKYITDSQTG